MVRARLRCPFGRMRRSQGDGDMTSKARGQEMGRGAWTDMGASSPEIRISYLLCDSIYITYTAPITKIPVLGPYLLALFVSVGEGQGVGCQCFPKHCCALTVCCRFATISPRCPSVGGGTQDAAPIHATCSAHSHLLPAAMTLVLYPALPPESLYSPLPSS